MTEIQSQNKESFTAVRMVDEAGLFGSAHVFELGGLLTAQCLSGGITRAIGVVHSNEGATLAGIVGLTPEEGIPAGNVTQPETWHANVQLRDIAPDDYTHLLRGLVTTMVETGTVMDLPFGA